MQYRTLPGTDMNVSEVCLGTMTWGEQNSEAEAHAQLDYAVGAGHQLHRYRGDVSGAAERADPGAHRKLSRHLARAAAARIACSSRRRSQGRAAATGSAMGAPT